MNRRQKLKKIYKDVVRDKYSSREIVPGWKGFVKEDFRTEINIVAPIPFNIIFSVIFELYCHLRFWRGGLCRFLHDQQRLRINLERANKRGD